MTKRFIPLAAVALLALAACENKPEVVDTTAPDPLAAEIANRGPIELPPAVKAEVTFRCKDNSLLYVTFFDGDKQAQVKTDKAGPIKMLKAEEAGKPFTAEGYSLSGDQKNVSVTLPGKGALTCRA